MSSEESKSGKDEKKRAVSAFEECPYILPGPTPTIDNIVIPEKCIEAFANSRGSDEETDDDEMHQSFGFMLHVTRDEKGKPKGVFYFFPVFNDESDGVVRDRKVHYSAHPNREHLDQFGDPLKTFIIAAQPAGGQQTKLHSRMAKVIRKEFPVKMNDKLTREQNRQTGEYVYAGAFDKGKTFWFSLINNRSRRNQCVKWDEDYLEFAKGARFDVAIPMEVMNTILEVMKTLPERAKPYLEKSLLNKKLSREKIIWPTELMHPDAYNFKNKEKEEEWQQIFHNAKEKDDNGNNGLMRAFRKYENPSVQWVQKFKNLGAHLDEADNEGNTALFIAAEKGWDGIVKVLISEGCRVNRSNYSGETPMSIAVDGRHFGIAALLFADGAAIPPELYENKDFINEVMLLLAQTDNVGKLSLITTEYPIIYGFIFDRCGDFLQMASENNAKNILAFMAKVIQDYLAQAGQGHPMGVYSAVTVLNGFPSLLNFDARIFVDYYLANLPQSETPSALLACLGISDQPAEAKSSQIKIPMIADVGFRNKVAKVVLDYYQKGKGSSAPIKGEMVRILGEMIKHSDISLSAAALRGSSAVFSKEPPKQDGGGGVVQSPLPFEPPSRDG